ncbi:MAG TPA: DsrE family protein [Blastocatellia bacterium]|jgi:sulfur transfer complex TusBCD TusB component (DsrH family)
MTSYLLIESRDPFESRDERFVEETALALRERGREVTVFLVQNGVLACRKLARGTYLGRLEQAGVTLLADDFSLRERGIRIEEMHPGVQPSSIEALVDHLAQEKTKAIWH